MTARSVYTILVALLLASTAPAQLSKLGDRLPAQKLTTAVDADGLKQWVKYNQNCTVCKGKLKEECEHCDHLEDEDLTKCPECDKTRKAKCHFCFGSGKFADPLTHAPCPGCNGHGWFICHLCGNTGALHLQGGNKKGLKCPSCKGVGGIKCLVCAGKGLVKSALKGKLGTAKLKDLEKAKATIGKLRADVKKYQWKDRRPSKARKEVKAIMKRSKTVLGPTKKLPGQFDTISKGLDQAIKDIEKSQERAWEYLQAYILYYLKHQEKVVDLCIERAKFNAEVVAKNKENK